MKAPLFLALVLLAFGQQSVAGGLDTGKTYIPVISYHSLDSLVRTNEYTAIYYWPAWCSGCRLHVPGILDMMRSKKNITLISVNDPESRAFLPKSLIGDDVVKGHYRIERYGHHKLVSINDRTQYRYFIWYFTRKVDKAQFHMNQFFLLFDRSGKLVYHNRTDLNVDSIRADLAGY